MKKMVLMALSMLLAVSVATAQTPDEKQASAERIQQLQTPAPKNCGIEEIDNLVSKCKSAADGMVSVNNVTSTLNGNATPEQISGLTVDLQRAAKDFEEAGKMLDSALAALKEVKNPLKLKPATKAIDYAKEVLTTSGQELPYQGKVVAALVQ